MAKNKKAGKKSSRAAVPHYVETNTFITGMVWLFTALSVVYLGIAYWRFG